MLDQHQAFAEALHVSMSSQADAHRAMTSATAASPPNSPKCLVGASLQRLAPPYSSAEDPKHAEQHEAISPAAGSMFSKLEQRGLQYQQKGTAADTAAQDRLMPANYDSTGVLPSSFSPPRPLFANRPPRKSSPLSLGSRPSSSVIERRDAEGSPVAAASRSSAAA